jgi:branched-chain amino acid transport system substrate-binding protein
MIVHAIEKSDGSNVNDMIAALSGWTFDAPKGTETIRAQDHAMLQPMYITKLSGAEPQLLRTLDPAAVAPPVSAFK